MSARFLYFGVAAPQDWDGSLSVEHDDAEVLFKFRNAGAPKVQFYKINCFDSMPQVVLIEMVRAHSRVGCHVSDVARVQIGLVGFNDRIRSVE